MQRFMQCLLMVTVMLLAICGTAFAEAQMVLVDTMQIPENRTFRRDYAADRFEGKIVLSEIRGSKVSSKPWIGFYAIGTDGKSVKFDLEFADENIQVCALYDDGSKKGLLARQYLLRNPISTHDKWRYNGTFVIEVVDGQAVITLGSESYTWPGVSALTGKMEVGRVSGKLEIYNYVRE